MNEGNKNKLYEDFPRMFLLGDPDKPFMAQIFSLETAGSI
jgi:hypothetical protein